MPGALIGHRLRGRGFSLVELAIVLAVMGLILGSLLVPFGAWHEMRGRRETDKALADIRDALIGYAIVKGRLPCPAVAATASGTAGAGTEARVGDACACAAGSAAASASGAACSTPTVQGVLPWATLGVPETDAWGRRYTYGVDAQFGRDPGQATFNCTPDAPPARAGFALCSLRHIDVKAAANGPEAVSGGVPAIVVSHGKNGFGAYTPLGSAIPLVGAGADEQENADGDAVFVANAGIDDQVMWLPTYVLMHRMLSAGLLP